MIATFADVKLLISSIQRIFGELNERGIQTTCCKWPNHTTPPYIGNRHNEKMLYWLHAGRGTEGEGGGGGERLHESGECVCVWGGG